MGWPESEIATRALRGGIAALAAWTGRRLAGPATGREVGEQAGQADADAADPGSEREGEEAGLAEFCGDQEQERTENGVQARGEHVYRMGRVRRFQRREGWAGGSALPCVAFRMTK